MPFICALCVCSLPKLSGRGELVVWCIRTYKQIRLFIFACKWFCIKNIQSLHTNDGERKRDEDARDEDATV